MRYGFSRPIIKVEDAPTDVPAERIVYCLREYSGALYRNEPDALLTFPTVEQAKAFAERNSGFTAVVPYDDWNTSW